MTGFGNIGGMDEDIGCLLDFPVLSPGQITGPLSGWMSFEKFDNLVAHICRLRHPGPDEMRLRAQVLQADALQNSSP